MKKVFIFIIIAVAALFIWVKQSGYMGYSPVYSPQEVVDLFDKTEESLNAICKNIAIWKTENPQSDKWLFKEEDILQLEGMNDISKSELETHMRNIRKVFKEDSLLFTLNGKMFSYKGGEEKEPIGVENIYFCIRAGQRRIEGGYTESYSQDLMYIPNPEYFPGDTFYASDKANCLQIRENWYLISGAVSDDG